MQDRVPTPGQEGRVLITPEDGSTPFYAKIEMADNPTQDGDPLNKETLLKDITAALFKLSTSAVPNDVFESLGKYNQYWWKRKAYQAHWETQSQSIEVTNDNYATYFIAAIFYDNSEVNVQRSHSISIGSDGTISLVNPSTFEVGEGQAASAIDPVRGYYCKQAQDTSSGQSDKILYVPYDSTSIKYSHGSWEYWCFNTIQEITSVYVEDEGDFEYVRSSDRNAYPDSGESGGYVYQFLGVPFDNAIETLKIEIGSYVGTGTYGESNPNTLTFGFVPKLVIVIRRYYAVQESGSAGVLWVGQPGDDLSSSKVFTVSGTTFSWYNTSSADQQSNANDTYYYLAIG